MLAALDPFAGPNTLARHIPRPLTYDDEARHLLLPLRQSLMELSSPPAVNRMERGELRDALERLRDELDAYHAALGLTAEAPMMNGYRAVVRQHLAWRAARQREKIARMRARIPTECSGLGDEQLSVVSDALVLHADVEHLARDAQVLDSTRG